MRIVMLGTRGVPARYGGFETAVEEVGKRLVQRGHQVVVYCRRQHDQEFYLGMRRVTLPAIRRPALETMSHSLLSGFHLSAKEVDVCLVFNAANVPVIPILKARGIPVALHVDGLEWKRSKWNKAGKVYYRHAESMSVRWADALIADAKGIQEYYRQRFEAETVLLAYGAPIVEVRDCSSIVRRGLAPRKFHLVVARLEPENHVDLIMRGYTASRAEWPLVVVGDVPYETQHKHNLKAVASNDDRIRMIGSVWDETELNTLYASCATYLHGHSVGGTNPSLLRAMGAAAPVIAFDVNFNREVAGEHGWYFTCPADVALALERAEREPEQNEHRGKRGQEHVSRAYRWDDVAEGYEALCARLIKNSSGRVNGLAPRGGAWRRMTYGPGKTS